MAVEVDGISVGEAELVGGDGWVGELDGVDVEVVA